MAENMPKSKSNEDQKSRVLLALSTPLGEVVKSWRDFRGLSLTELANRTQITKGYLSQLEHNKIGRPSDEYLTRLATALGISKDDLLAREMPLNEGQADKPPGVLAGHTINPSSSKGTWGSPIRIGGSSRGSDRGHDEEYSQPKASPRLAEQGLEWQIGVIVAQFSLPPEKARLARMLIQASILEGALGICRILKDELE